MCSSIKKKRTHKDIVLTKNSGRIEVSPFEWLATDVTWGFVANTKTGTYL